MVNRTSNSVQDSRTKKWYLSDTFDISSGKRHFDLMAVSVLVKTSSRAIVIACQCTEGDTQTVPGERAKARRGVRERGWRAFPQRGRRADDVCLLSILPLLFHSTEDQWRAYWLMNMYRRDLARSLVRAKRRCPATGRARVEGGRGQGLETDGNDRERDTEKLTSHRPPEITRGDKQSIAEQLQAWEWSSSEMQIEQNFRTVIAARNAEGVWCILLGAECWPVCRKFRRPTVCYSTITRWFNAAIGSKIVRGCT